MRSDLLRDWRTRRRLSQLELAIRADVSARHISFVETGRTAPSSDMVLRLAEQLEVPLRDRNRLLVAHAPVFRDRPHDDPDDARVRAALQQILLVYEPYPAVAVDHRWNVLLANRPFEALVEECTLPRPLNLMRLGLHPRGLAVTNRSQVRAYLLPRLRRQAAHRGDPELHALYQELATEQEQRRPRPDPADIALPIRLRHRGVELWFINTITTFGAAFDVALEDVAIETYLPADEITARHCRGLDG